MSSSPELEAVGPSPAPAAPGPTRAAVAATPRTAAVTLRFTSRTLAAPGRARRQPRLRVQLREQRGDPLHRRAAAARAELRQLAAGLAESVQELRGCLGHVGVEQQRG